MAQHEIYAIRYATHDRMGSANFVAGAPDLHDVAMPLDYYVWLIRGPAGDILVDVGFGEEQAAARGQHPAHAPRRGPGSPRGGPVGDPRYRYYAYAL